MDPSPSKGSILLLKGARPAAKLALGESTVIGRSSECEVQILDPQLSRRHSLIRLEGDGCRIEDLGSRNGTFVNGRRIDGSERLSDGDEIRFGTVAVIFNPAVDLLYERDGGRALCLLDEKLLAEAAFEQREETAFAADDLDRESLLDLYSMTCEAMAELDLAPLLSGLLERLVGHFFADRGFILLIDPKTGRMRPAAIHAEKDVMAVSRSLVQHVIEEKKPLLLRDAVEDLSFVGSKSVVAHELRSVMMVPLSSRDEVMGIMQLDRKEKNAFDGTDLARLSLLARAAAPAVLNAQRFDRSRRAAEVMIEASGVKGELIGESECIRALVQMGTKAAATDARVLIRGKSGTGKELLARMIHAKSGRSDGPFIAINCAAVPETMQESELFGHEKGAFTGAVRRKKGCFELADEGTLFLDEVGELSPAMQVKLLRVLAEGSFFRVGGEKPVDVDARVLAATNRDLEKMIEEGSFRQDLFYRLNVIQLVVPPLRERSSDIRILFLSFLNGFASSMGKKAPKIGSEAMALLERYPWPGNVRELKNVAERVMVFSDGFPIEPADLPPEITEITADDGRAVDPPGSKLRETLAATERELLVKALNRAKGKKAQACRILGISRPTLDKKISEYEIEMETILR